MITIKTQPLDQVIDDPCNVVNEIYAALADRGMAQNVVNLYRVLKLIAPSFYQQLCNLAYQTWQQYFRRNR